MKILNLTQHEATPEQLEAGVYDPAARTTREIIRGLLSFYDVPTPSQMQSRAETLASIARICGSEYVMIGGAPFFMSTLEKVLILHGIRPLHAFSVRKSVERTAADGTVTKTSVFKHAGFVHAFL